jgi:hypothetical protein
MRGMTTSVTSRWISPGWAGDAEGFRAVRGGDHVVAVAGEDPPGYLAQGFLVLDDQDGLSLGRPLVGHRFCQRGRGLRGDWQHDAERGASAGFGVDLDVAFCLGEDPVDGGQAEPGSGALILGGEERLEYMLNYVRGHSGAGVADPQPHVPAQPRLGSTGNGVGVHGDVAGVDGQRAPAGHGVAGVDREIH